ncbi:hypothetical protein [Mycobacterium sherrisii]|uniref:hypothetical protein n=1 Tax=Mycobacterium sherrisii TaxID=243061 RepID=UPI000A164ACC|nr:hypothetical protein [Mycobacterium sherrisii]MCV7028320.1 hypothetical protein [Mycobacterium sherrisii]ORW87369.1 hypothetical protein AWC25_00615 [Mycobacterium sherrisii]
MAEDKLDTLYSVQPAAFTAQRTKLAAAAKKRGDAATAKRIAAARKPTTAAWVVNQLALSRTDVKQRLADLGDRLRAAHAAMDGHQIRELSGEQHRLIDELTRAALAGADAAGVKASAAVREDVTSTLQAAIADPGARDRLGRLDRPERYSGFGASEGAPAPVPTRAPTADPRSAKLTAAVAAAEADKAEADDMLARRQDECDAARLRRDRLLADLRKAERELDRAQQHYDKAQQVSREAAEALQNAKARLERT